ncbi:glycosyltransferase family 4 protein [Viridibacterium curvum]|uniref:Glycosyltransferase family 4 protein n=1 Tax=Viridibacterium curvum TaxID=1101404 RepID=A0ABP9QZK2_9RHOO
MKIAMLGLRGFPEVQGGVETHCAHLCPLLVELGCDVTVIARAGYQKPGYLGGWKGVKFRALWTPRSKGAEAIVHTFLGVLYAGLVLRPDVLHIQAIGPALMTPLARLLGLRVVVTHHGPDYDRQKWGRLARSILRMGEACGMRWANARIVISRTIRDLVKNKYGLDSALIPNGVTLPELPDSTGALTHFGLEPGKYVLLVSRLVPEKRHLDLINAFAQAALPGWKLALVGGSDHPDDYSRAVEQAVQRSPAVVATGFQSGLALRELYAHAGGFVLPSSHEGLPIALLEALSFGLPVIASDIPANLEVGLPEESYFPLGDVATLAARLSLLATGMPEPESATRQARREWVVGRYDWHQIATATRQVYLEATAS